MQQFPCACPHVLTAMPILVLGCADFALQSLGTSSGVCTFRQTFLNEFPASVDLLGATFGLQGFAARKFMRLEIDKVGLGPLPLAILLDSLLLVYHRVMQHTWHLEFVGLCWVSMEDNVAVRQPLFTKRGPALLGDRPRAWCARNSQGRIQAAQDEGLWLPTLNKARPLLPQQTTVIFDCFRPCRIRRDIFLVTGGFVTLDVGRFHRGTKDNVLLLHSPSAQHASCGAAPSFSAYSQWLCDWCQGSGGWRQGIRVEAKGITGLLALGETTPQARDRSGSGCEVYSWKQTSSKKSSC